MAHYVGVFAHLPTGEWRGLLPDLPGYDVAERSLDLAILRATGFLDQLRRLGTPVPPPRPLAFIELDTDWASRKHIDWSQSVISMIELRE